MYWVLAILVFPWRLGRAIVVWLVETGKHDYRRITELVNAPKGTHGNAAFATWRELKQRQKPGGWLLGYHKRSWWRKPVPIYSHHEASIFGAAAKGTGKTEWIVANLRDMASREARQDIVLYDPKGDIEKATRKQLEAGGYRVELLDFTNPKNSCTFDVMRCLSAHSIHADCEAMAQLMAPRNANSHNIHFEDYPVIMLAGIICHMWRDQKPHGVCWGVEQLITTHAKREKLLKEFEGSFDYTIQGAENAWRSVSDRERGSFISSNYRKLRVFLRPAVAKVLGAGGGFTWEEMFDDTRPWAVFMRAPVGSEETAAVRLVMGTAVNAAQSRWDVTGQRLSKGLWVVVDEAASIGRCDPVMTANNVLRSAGVNVAMWFLNWGDLKALYPNAMSYLGGCDWVVYGEGKDADYYETVSRLIGDVTVMSKGESESNQGEGKSRHETARRLVKPDELRQMPRSELVTLSGNLVIKLKRPKVKVWY